MSYLITLIPEISGAAGTWKEKLILENDFFVVVFGLGLACRRPMLSYQKINPRQNIYGRKNE